MASLMRSRAALLIKRALPARLRPEDIAPEGPCSLALVLLDRLFLADDRRTHRVVDDLFFSLDLGGAVRTDVHVRGCRFCDLVYVILARDSGALLYDLAVFHVNL